MVLELLALVAAGSTAVEQKVFCAEQTAFILAPGEQLRSVAPGIHIGTASVDTPRGSLIIRDGHHWAEPKSIDEDILLQSGVRIVKATMRGSSEGPTYAVYGRLDGRHWGDRISSDERVVAWISGRALQGNRRDDTILERIRVFPLDSLKCTFRLNYGWDVILGDE